MSFISYAQNYEDVMLWRALKHVQNGFYIDVGANDPVEDSVTKAFYDRGWRGINIEPLASHHQDLSVARSDDINLRCAVGSKRGKVRIWECDVRGWATASPQVIKKHEQDGHKGIFHSVSLVRLADICEQHVTNEIHFLKIDVEGLEEDVLKGMNFKKFRPWIVLIEATRPNSTEEIHLSWEELILSENYVLAYADGLNRFYVSKEQASSLIDALRYPPNVFDGYMRVQQLESELRAQRAETDLHNAVEMAQACKAQTVQLEQAKEQAQEKIVSLEAIETAHLQQIKTLNDELDAVRKELHTVHQANHHHWTQLEQTKQELHAVHQSNHHHWELAEKRQERINALLSSRSWRVTAPLRWPAHQQRLLIQYGFLHRFKAATKKVVRKANQLLVAQPFLRQLLIACSHKLGFYSKLKKLQRKFAGGVGQAEMPEYSGLEPDELVIMPPRAQQIYAELKEAIARHQKGEA